MRSVHVERLTLLTASLGFLIWSAVFIARSSHVAIDGQRYFSLYDDGMISMRYAWNLSHGYGPVWNPGERVEGYTNPLMVLVMALMTVLLEKRFAVLAIQILGALLMLGIASTAIAVAEHINADLPEGRRALLRTLTFIGVLSYYPLAFWSLMGMETSLQVLLILTSILAAFRYIDQPRAPGLVTLLVLLMLAYLARPDTLIASTLIFAFLFMGIQNGSLPQRTRMRLALAFGMYVMLVVVHFLFRRAYYGTWLPNTYTMKMTGYPLHERLRNGAIFAMYFLRSSGVFLVVAAAGGVLRFKRKKAILIFLAAAIIAYQIWIGGDVDILWRFLAPSVPLVTIVFVHEVSHLIYALSGSSSVDPPRSGGVTHLVPGLTATVLTIVPLFVILNAQFLPEIIFARQPVVIGGNHQQIDRAVALNEIMTEDATVGAFHAGVVPYYTGLRAIDFLGKADPIIARVPPDAPGEFPWYGLSTAPAHNKYDLDYSIKTLQPTYVEYVAWNTQDISEWASSRYIIVQTETLADDELWVLSDSQDVLWSKVSYVGE